MIAALVLALVADAGHLPRNAFQCAAIEYNEVENDEGQVRLRQVILWDFHEERQRLHVVHYVVTYRPPLVMRSPCGWRTWIDTADGPRLVEAASYRTSRTWNDPEVDDRQNVACERRRGPR